MNSGLLRIIAGTLTICSLVMFTLYSSGESSGGSSENNSAAVSSIIAEKDKMIEFLTNKMICLSKGVLTTGGFCLNPNNPFIGGNHQWDGKACAAIEELVGASTIGDFGAGLGHYGNCLLRTGKSFIRTKNQDVLKSLQAKYDTEMARGNLIGKPKVVKSWEGFDGALNVDEMSGGNIHYADLGEPMTLGKKFDWVVSIEVGEHIPKAKEETFITNLVNHACKGIVVSWAVKGQGGHHHINNQNNDYIEERMKEKGLTKDEDSTKKIRDAVFLPYFKNTMMVYRFPQERC